MRFVKFTTLFLCGVLVLALAGCGTDTIEEAEENETILTPTPERRVPDYYPNAIGNRWVYRHSDGSQWTREVTRERVLAGRTYRVFDYTPPIEDTEFDYLRVPSYRITPHRVLFFVGEEINNYFEHDLKTQLEDIFAEDNTRIHVNAISGNELIFFRIPPTGKWDVLDLKIKGNIIFVDFNQALPFEIHFLIKGAVIGSEVIETPAGIFETTSKIQYDLQITTTVEDEEDTTSRQTDTIWLAPDVGIVKIENENGTTELIELIFLKSIKESVIINRS